MKKNRLRFGLSPNVRSFIQLTNIDLGLAVETEVSKYTTY